MVGGSVVNPDGADGAGSGGEAAGSPGLGRLVVGGGILATLVVAALTLPVREWLVAFLEWTESLGPLGPVVFIGVYVVATVLFLPGSLLTLGAGLLFGLVRGTIAVSIGSTLGVTAAFLVGRYVARRRIEAALSDRPKFAAIDDAVGREGFKIVLLTRLSPAFPFNLLNYAFGVTRVRLRDYVIASWIGMLPGTVMYVYFGTLAKNLAALAAGDVGASGAGRTALLIVGLIATVVVTIVVTRTARRALRDAIERDPEP